MKRFLQVALILMLMVVLTVSGLAAPKVTLRVAWWGNTVRNERTAKVIEMYMKANPHVTIETEFTGWQGYWDKLATQAAANNLPDIIQHDYAYLDQFVSKKLLLNLSPYIRSKKLDLSTVSETLLDGGKLQGDIYAVSLGTNAACMVYDPAILKRAGVAAPTVDWTWVDFERIATEVYGKTGVQTAPIYAPTDPKVGFENWIRQGGYSMYNQKGDALGFKDGKILTEFFDIQLRLLKAKALIRPENAFLTTTMEEEPFATGKSWIAYGWSSQVVAYASAAKRPVAVILNPKIAGSKRPGDYLKPSQFFTVARTTAHKDEAVKFINYFLNDLEANRVLLGERGVPIVPKVRNDLKKLVDPITQQTFEFIELLEDGRVSPIDPPEPPGAAEVTRLFRTVTQEVLFEAASPRAATERFMKQANTILAKNRK